MEISDFSLHTCKTKRICVSQYLEPFFKLYYERNCDCAQNVFMPNTAAKYISGVVCLNLIIKKSN